MEKLIELLNQYEKEGRKSEYYEWEKGIGGPFLLFRRDTYDEEGSHLYSDTSDTYVISKKYGFIKWLVENDKIDYQKSPGEIMFDDRMGTTFSLEDSIVMMLSISSTPIKDLISYLR